MIDEIGKSLLKEVADLDALPVGAYNVRVVSIIVAEETVRMTDCIAFSSGKMRKSAMWRSIMVKATDAASA